MSYHDKLPEMFDPRAHEGTQAMQSIPQGWYLAHIVEAEVRDAANGNGNYLLTVFEVLEGDFLHRKIYQNITLANASQQAVEIGKRLLTDVYTACGITEPTQEIDVLLYKPVKIRVAIKRDPAGEYPDGNRIYAVRPQDYVPKRGPSASPSIGPSASVAAKPDLPWNQK
jgi:hypothetical protein